MKLTDAQIYTLRRMINGSVYLLRGDGKKGTEHRRCAGRSLGYEAINASSVPVLFRNGLVDYVVAGEKTPTMYYKVTTTPDGNVAACERTSTEERK